MYSFSKCSVFLVRLKNIYTLPEFEGRKEKYEKKEDDEQMERNRANFFLTAQLKVLSGY